MIRFRHLIFGSLLSIPAFPVVSSPAAAQETPVATGGSASLPDTAVKQKIDAFFSTLRLRKVDDAYKKLFAGSPRATEEPEIYKSLAAATAQVLEISGEIGAPELIRVRSSGKTLREVTYVLNGSKRPVLWRFYLYFTEGIWQVLDTTVATKATAFFEETKPAAP